MEQKKTKKPTKKQVKRAELMVTLQNTIMNESDNLGLDYDEIARALAHMLGFIMHAAVPVDKRIPFLRYISDIISMATRYWDDSIARKN